MSIAAANQLGHSLSPYLLQHAENPVHWQAWDATSLALAREHDVPILLSIGYAACHWCHVMEHESFASPEIAKQMNDNFVCIKVDREERPDLDKTYQAAHYLLSRQSGGWPLTVFLAPDLVPFFTGTYFPPVERRGMLSFATVLQRVTDAWTQRRAEIVTQNKLIARSLRELDDSQSGDAVPAVTALAAANARLVTDFDMEHGGLGKAPKFPQVPALLYALHMCAAGATDLRAGLLKTLDAMASGGLHDHVGGGFFRYCVDPLWDIPHFEKMHYDNAQLLELYAQASITLQQPAYAQVAKQTAGWLLEHLTSAAGGILAAWDADSDGREGGYYLWQIQDLDNVLSADERKSLAKHLNVSGPPNFEGAYHLRQAQGKGYTPPLAEHVAMLGRMRGVRDEREPPTIDDKVLAVACGMGARGLARAGNLLSRTDWLDAARLALRFATEQMEVNGELRTAWRAGRSSEIGAFLDDHANLLAAHLALLEIQCDATALNATLAQADVIVANYDDGEGGLLFSPKDAENVLRRIRASDDGPTPSGNGVAACALLQLGWMLGRTDYLAVAQRILAGFALVLEQAPVHSLTLARALDWWHRPPAIVTLTGDAVAIESWRVALVQTVGPQAIIVPLPEVIGLVPPLVKSAPPAGTSVWAHVCRGTTCLAPFTQLEILREEIARQPAQLPS